MGQNCGLTHAARYNPMPKLMPKNTMETPLTDRREIDMDKRDLTPIAKLPEYARLCRELETALRGMMEMHGDMWDRGYVDDRVARAAAFLSLHNTPAQEGESLS